MGSELKNPSLTWAWRQDHSGSISIGERPTVVRFPFSDKLPTLPGGVRGHWASETPFISQSRLSGERTCGAAALAMALHAAGAPCTAEELWTEIACPDGQGELAARTHHLAAAAIRRGVPAMIVQVREGWKDLYHIASQVAGLILNQRLDADSWQGHFTVLLDINKQSALLHDPQFGPARLVSREKFEQLWQPLPGVRGEIAGRVLVGIGPRVQHAGRCESCAMPFPKDVTCSHCGQYFILQPAPLLGCMRSSCGRCRWERLFCPHCDASFGPLL